jgi:hypothetical protein
MLRTVDDLFKTCKLPDWKFVKTRKGVNCYQLKTADTGLHRVKFEGTLPVSWKVVFDLLKDPQNIRDIWHDPNYAGDLEIITDKDNFKEYRQEFYLPFPLTKRDTVISQWNYCEPTRGVIVAENMKKEVPRKKGFVRAKVHIIGYVMEQGQSPNETSFTHVFCVDSKGSMPVWVQNKISEDYHANVQRLIKYFAKK